MSFIELKARYPEYIPAVVIVDKELEPFIKKKKYLIPKDVNFGIVMATIRKNISLQSSDGLIYIVDNRILSPNVMMYEFANERNEFLYIKIIKESVFG